MRTMFVLYLVFIVAGLGYLFTIGFLQRRAPGAPAGRCARAV